MGKPLVGSARLARLATMNESLSAREFPSNRLMSTWGSIPQFSIPSFRAFIGVEQDSAFPLPFELPEGDKTALRPYLRNSSCAGTDELRLLSAYLPSGTLGPRVKAGSNGGVPGTGILN